MEFNERELGILIDLTMDEYNKVGEENENYLIVLEQLLKKLGVPIELLEEMKSFLKDSA